MARKPYADRNGTLDLIDQAHIDDQYVYPDGKGDVLRDSDGYPVLNKKALQNKVIDIVLSLPMATRTSKPTGGTYHNILVGAFPSLKVSNFSTLEEEQCYKSLKARIATICKIKRGGKVQDALAADGTNRVLCQGGIPVSGAGDQPGIWLSDSPSATGPIAGQLDGQWKQWIKDLDPVLDYGNLATDRVPGLGKPIVAQIDSHMKELTAKVNTFKQKMLAAAAESNGNQSQPAADDDANDVDDQPRRRHLRRRGEVEAEAEAEAEAESVDVP